MEGYSRNNEGCRQFLEFMEKERDSVAERGEEISHHSPSLEQKLELRLAPPGGDWSIGKTSRETEHEFVYSNGFFAKSSSSQISSVLKQEKSRSRSESKHVQLLSVTKESSQTCGGRVNQEKQNSEKTLIQSSPGNTAVPNFSSAHKRSSPASVVGWPPVRSFRKNLGTGNSSKLATQSENESVIEGCKPALFVKINMDGVPIGRKIDINSYDNYEKLSKAVDQLFKDLLPVQIKSCDEGTKGFSIFNENREYTLVYEDNEGDRMLVGDLPWPMFVSKVKRLRVLKTTEVSMLQDGCKQQGKLS